MSASTVVAFDEIENRLRDFSKGAMAELSARHAVARGIARALVCMAWEGTPSVLADAFRPGKDDMLTFKATLERIGYICELKTLNASGLSADDLPCFVRYNGRNAILLEIHEGELSLYDYVNDIVCVAAAGHGAVRMCAVSPYSRIFREPPPQSQDRRNWVKYCFYRYGKDIKNLLWLSFFINLLSIVPPFFIMAVYSFALVSESTHTLLWLFSGAALAATLELYYKYLRMRILVTSGKELSLYISYHVLSKLLWLPYAITSGAGVSSQMARLRDIDHIRNLATSASTISYFDLPFVSIFIIAILVVAGPVGVAVLAGIMIMLGFCVYARFLYRKVTSQSSRANAAVNHQWNEILQKIGTVQRLPVFSVIRSRFSSAHEQSIRDADTVAVTNGSIQRIGQAFIQIIGVTAIVASVYSTMEGYSSPGTMIAIIILIWKTLTPVMGVYNAIIKFQTLRNSSEQINALMALDDNKTRIEKSTPVNRLHGHISVKDMTYRHPGGATGLSKINFTVRPGEKTAIVGPPGCGKTTLLNMLSGINENYQGTVSCDGYNVRQFNNFTYRNAIRYVPYNLHFFDTTVAENFYLYNGEAPEHDLKFLLTQYGLNDYLGADPLNTRLESGLLATLPGGVRQLLRLCIGLGNCEQKLVLIDTPLAGCERDFASVFFGLSGDRYAEKTLIYTTGDRNLIAAADSCLMLDAGGEQKYFGFPDKALRAMRE